jgi:hypothetical protein
MADDKAAFGVFPHLKAKRSKQDAEAAKNVPVDLARGALSGVLGAPGDIESLIRLLPGLSEETILPTSEDIEKRIPFRSESPVSQAATGLGQLAGGFYTGRGSPLRAIAAIPGALKHGAQEFAKASAAGAPHLTVWHGSPHKFAPTPKNPLGEFDPRKIGTGEGAQAYGHGHYTAEAKGVGSSYQPRSPEYEQKLLTLYEQARRRSNYPMMEVLEDAMLHKDPEDILAKFGNADEGYTPQHMKAAKEFASWYEKNPPEVGGLYKIDLSDEAIPRMLDWDVKFDKQHPDVQKAILKYWEDNPSMKYYGDPKELTGEGIYGSVSAATLGPEGGAKVNLNPAREAASMDLRHYGIPGIKYLDGGSRGGGEGTRNFVVFPGNEDLLNILERKKEGGSVSISNDPEVMCRELEEKHFDKGGRANKDEMKATPVKNKEALGVSRAVQKAHEFLSKPFGYQNPPGEMLSELVGLPAVAKTLERIGYGEPLTTGAGGIGGTTRPREEVVDAAMAVAPLAQMTKGMPVGLTFIGPNAKTFDGNRAMKAVAMEKKGADPVDIWRATGTFRGADGIWRQEISDQAAKFLTSEDRALRIAENKLAIDKLKEQIAPTPQKDLFPKALTEAKKEAREEISGLKGENKLRQRNPRTQGLNAPYIFEHPELYKAYPELRNVNITTEGGSGSTRGQLSIVPSHGQIPGSLAMDIFDAGLRGNPTSTTLHEMQHAVQTIEGMHPGGNPKFAFSDPIAYEMLKKERLKMLQAMPYEDFVRQGGYTDMEQAGKDYTKYTKDLQKGIDPAYDRYLQENVARDYYKRLGGEAEARAVQERMDMSPSQRQAEFPYASYDILPEEIIVKPPHEYKEGGVVVSDNPDTMMLELQDQHFGIGGLAERGAKKVLSFFSKVDEVAKELPRTKGTGAEFMKELEKAKGVKPAEIQHRKLDEIKALPKMTKEGFLEELEKRPPAQLEEKVLGGKQEFDAKRLAELEKEYKALKQHPIDDPSFGEEKYNELIRLMNIRDQSTINTLYDAAEQATRSGQRAQKQGNNLTAEKYFREAEFLNTRAEKLDLEGQGQANPPKYDRPDLILPGGQNYREILLKLPDTFHQAKENLRKFQDEMKQKYGRLDWRRAAGADDQYMHDKLLAAEKQEAFRSSHYDEPNVIAHARVSDRVTPEGERVLHVEEIQSDWHQAGRKKGYANKNAEQEYVDYLNDLQKRVAEDIKQTMIKEGVAEEKAATLGQNMAQRIADDPRKLADFLGESEKQMSLHQARLKAREGVPDAPFKKNWHELMMNRILADAAEKGYDRVAISPGVVQAERYDLSRHLNEINYGKNADGTYSLTAVDKNGRVALNEPTMTESQLENMVGKEVAQKIVSGEGKEFPAGSVSEGKKTLTGLDLQVGGEGMKGFYDKMLPDYLNSLGKKYGVQVETMPLQSGEKMVQDRAGLGMIRSGEPNYIDLHSFKITPEMRQEFTEKGFPMYSVAAPVGIGATQMEEPKPVQITDNPDAMMMEVEDRGFDKGGEVKATPRSEGWGMAADLAKSIEDASKEQFGYKNPVTEEIANFLRIPELARTLERKSYGQPITNINKANVPIIPEDTSGAIEALAPLSKPALKGAKALGKAAAKEIDKAMFGESKSGVLNALTPQVMSVYKPHTPLKPDPDVGIRYKVTDTGGLAPRQDLNIENLQGSQVKIFPWDATSRNKLVTEVSDIPLQKPVLTEGGDDYMRDLQHIKQRIAGASNEGIAKRIMDRINEASVENQLLGNGTGRVFGFPVRMGAKAEYASTFPTDIMIDIMEQAGLKKAEKKALDESMRNMVFEGKKGVFKDMAPFGSKEFFEQLKNGLPSDKEKKISGFTDMNMRKAFMDRMALVEQQKRLGYNIQDLTGSVLAEELKGVPKGYVGNVAAELDVFGKLRPSKSSTYSHDFPGVYAGSMPNMPVEILMPKTFENIYKEMKAEYPNASKEALRNMAIGAMEKRKNAISEKIGQRNIDAVKTYQEGLMKGEFDPNNIQEVYDYMRRKKLELKMAEGGKVTNADNGLIKVKNKRKAKA